MLPADPKKSQQRSRLARSAPWASLSDIADAAGVTTRETRNKLVALPGRGACAETARRMSMPRCRTERRLRGIASGWCPPGAVRSAGGDEDNLEFVCAVADHATGSAAWQARTQYPLGSYERDDYGNDKALIGCPLAELRSGYPGMWSNPACPPTVMTAAVALFATHNA